MAKKTYTLEEHLCFQLYQSSRAMTRLYQRVLKDLGLTYPQYLVMVVLWDQRFIGFKALSDLLNLKTGTLSPLLKRLEDEGLIERVHDPEDDRKVSIKITNKGLSLEEQGANVPCLLLEHLNLDNDSYLNYLKVSQHLRDHLETLEER